MPFGSRRWEREGADCRVRLLGRFHQGHTDEPAVQLGQDQVARYLERQGFSSRRPAERMGLLQSVLVPPLARPEADQFLRRCCGLECGGRSRSRCDWGSGMDDRSRTMAATFALRLEAEAAARSHLRALGAQGAMGLGLNLWGNLEGEYLAAQGAAHLAFGIHSRRGAAFQRELDAVRTAVQRLLANVEPPGDAGAEAPVSSGPEPEEAAMALSRLEALAGLDGVKESVREIVDQAALNVTRLTLGLPSQPVSAHLIFMGRPGTGKTTVARLYAQALRHAGVLARGHLVEVGRTDLVGGYIGQTALKTRSVCQRALDGVLFVDEAYSLAPPGPGGGVDFGAEALAELLQFMENNRDRMSVVVAGYTAPMHAMLASNEGLLGRFNAPIHFDDYTDAELRTILRAELSARELTADDDIAEVTIPALLPPRDSMLFANARSVRQLVARAVGRQCARLGAACRASGEAPSRAALTRLSHEDFTGRA